jgi:hypothetical protein
MDIELGRHRAAVKPGYTRHQLATKNFDGCNLSGYFLEGRALNQARFLNADLSGASLARCSLQNATFQDATLIGTNFKGADLKFADFSGAFLVFPKFNGADLRHSRGLSDDVIALARAQGARLSHAIKKPESHATKEHPQAEETRLYKLPSRDNNKSMAAEIATGVFGLILGVLTIGSPLLSSGSIAWWIVFIIVAGWFFG